MRLRYQNWTLVSVPDIETWFLSHTSPLPTQQEGLTYIFGYSKSSHIIAKTQIFSYVRSTNVYHLRPKFLITAKAQMSAIIGPNNLDFFDLSLHCASVVCGMVLNPVLTNLLSASSQWLLELTK